MPCPRTFDLAVVLFFRWDGDAKVVRMVIFVGITLFGTTFSCCCLFTFFPEMVTLPQRIFVGGFLHLREHFGKKKLRFLRHQLEAQIVFFGVPSTNRHQPQSERWQRQAKDKEGTPLKKSLTLTRLVETTLPRQFPRNSTTRAEDVFQTVQNWPDVFVGLQIES